MKKIFFLILFTISFGLGMSPASGGETILQYINACKTQVGFTSTPTLKCGDGLRFATTTNANDPESNDNTNDFLGFASLNDAVDLVFACRWLTTDLDGKPEAASIEMMITNRQNGNTCFFSGKEYSNPRDSDPQLFEVPATLVSITDPDTTKITNYWHTPDELNGGASAFIKCVNCHVAGQYIVSPRIAPFMAQFGLLNDGHETMPFTLNNGTPVLTQPARYHSVVTPNLPGGVTSAFATWDNDARSYINDINDAANPNYNPYGCSAGCHSIGGASPLHDDLTRFALVVIPSILSDLSVVIDKGVMVPYSDDSNYRWINLDTPGDGVEAEIFATAKSASTTLVPTLLSNCAAPGVMEAHVVGTQNEFIIAQPGRFAFLPDRLSVFNLKDGLVCLNSDQEPGQTCSDYRIHYECTDPSGNKTWTDWYNMDSPSGDGDHEERSKDANVCTSPAGSTATAIEAAVTLNGSTYSSLGPNDRLASFSQYGLTCNNSDQPDGKCSNYVVRYSSCDTPPQQQPNKTLTNRNVPASGSKQLTAASGSLVKAQGHNSAWNTQAWTIEPVLNTEYVRVHNVPTNVYLTVTSTAEQATVGTAGPNTTINEMWLIEPISGSTDVRLKNLFSGKYLTMGDPNSYTGTPDYIPIFSQGRNTSWNTQRWVIQ